MEKWVENHPFLPSSSVDVSAPYAVLVAQKTSGETARPSEGSIRKGGFDGFPRSEGGQWADAIVVSASNGVE